ncbi:MAG: hypothetical protein WHU95_07640 [candidate division WOR-3 bacterium]|nr:hypothetical protein [candidate division WOR-3 bacterium]MDH7519699.1 hypothetical protein [bacterium]
MDSPEAIPGIVSTALFMAFLPAMLMVLTGVILVVAPDVGYPSI